MCPDFDPLPSLISGAKQNLQQTTLRLPEFANAQNKTKVATCSYMGAHKYCKQNLHTNFEYKICTHNLHMNWSYMEKFPDRNTQNFLHFPSYLYRTSYAISLIEKILTGDFIQFLIWENYLVNSQVGEDTAAHWSR